MRIPILFAPRTPGRFRKILRRFLGVVLFLFVITLGINLYVILSARKAMVVQIADLPRRDVALVLGTEPVRPDGSVNLHFLGRTDLAAKIYLAGKVQYLLISGNANNRGFNEVLEMRKRISQEHVPDQALQVDFGGFRTWESVRRAGEVYHLQKLILVTDSFHAPRALFLCRHFGIDAVAICPAHDPIGWWLVRYQTKEYFARLIAVFDTIARHEPGT